MFIAGGDVSHLGGGCEFHNFIFIGEIPDAYAVVVGNPTDSIAATKTVTGSAAPNPWDIAITSNTAGCALPVPYDTNPTLMTVDGSGGLVNFVNLLVDDGAGMPRTCICDVAVTAQAGYTDTTPMGTLTGLNVTDGGTTSVTVTCTVGNEVGIPVLTANGGIHAVDGVYEFTGLKDGT